MKFFAKPLFWGSALLAALFALGLFLDVSPPARDAADRERSAPPAPARHEEAASGSDEYEYGTVARIFDGDTIQLARGNLVRYIGIDTPEKKGPHTAEECFSKEATAKNEELVLGKEVRLEADTTDRDKYGRLLRYVFWGDTFVNKELAESGHARTLNIPPNMRYAKELAEAVQKAKENGRGLWGACE